MNGYPIYGDGRWDIKSGTEHVVAYLTIIGPRLLIRRKPALRSAFEDPQGLSDDFADCRKQCLFAKGF